MFDKFKKAVQGVVNDVSKNVANQVGNNTSNQVYENMHDNRYEYYAYQTIRFSDYEGTIVDLPSDRGSVYRCKSSTEVLEKLTEKLNAEFELCKRLNQPFPKQTPLDQVKAKKPNNSTIISIFPSANK